MAAVDPQKPPVKKVPVLPCQDHEALLHGHLFIHHDLYMGGLWDYGKLVAEHEEDHKLYAHLLSHPHTHAAPEPEEEFSWG